MYKMEKRRKKDLKEKKRRERKENNFGHLSGVNKFLKNNKFSSMCLVDDAIMQNTLKIIKDQSRLESN